jgi:hypothetical protein
MKRRKFLASVGTGSLPLVAGCAGGNNGEPASNSEDESDSGSDTNCSLPEDPDIKSWLPGRPVYEPVSKPEVEEVEKEGVESSVYVLYDGPHGETISFAIGEYTSPNIAAKKAREYGPSSPESTIGYILIGRYAFVSIGPDKQSIAMIMNESELSGDCVGSRLTYVPVGTPEATDL